MVKLDISALTCTYLWPILYKDGLTQDSLLIDTTAVLPVLHVFRGTGKANMHELIMEWTQTIEGRDRVWCKKLVAPSCPRVPSHGMSTSQAVTAA